MRFFRRLLDWQNLCEEENYLLLFKTIFSMEREMYNPNLQQNGMCPSSINLPTMTNLPHSQMGNPRFAGNGVSMMIAPGFSPHHQFLQPVYIMDHQNQIHLINVQVSRLTIQCIYTIIIRASHEHLTAVVLICFLNIPICNAVLVTWHRLSLIPAPLQISDNSSVVQIDD